MASANEGFTASAMLSADGATDDMLAGALVIGVLDFASATGLAAVGSTGLAAGIGALLSLFSAGC